MCVYYTTDVQYALRGLLSNLDVVDNLVDNAVLLGFVSSHPTVALHILMDTLSLLAGVLCHDPFEQLLNT